jgi:hypothetical protein
MADDGLEALRQGYEASLRQLQTLLDAQARLRETAEELAADTRRQLERVAEALCPQLVDGLCKRDPLGLAGVASQALAEAVARDVQRRLSRMGAAKVAGKNVGELYEAAVEELARLREKNARLEDDLAAAHKRTREVELDAAVVRRSLEEARGGYAPAAEAAPSRAPGPSARHLPGWMQAWQEEETFGHDRALLVALAETGVARHHKAASLLEERLGMEAGSDQVAAAFRRCRERLGLIEVIESADGDEGTTPRRPDRLLRLTQRGTGACRLLLGRDPAPSLATGMLARHEKPERALLVLQAADALREAGYEVDVLPAAVDLPGGRSFVPHLAAARNGRALLAEVMSGPRRQADRWRDYGEASGGCFHVIVPDGATLDRVKSEILFWAGQRSLKLRMMALADARRGDGEEVWTFRRDATQ